MMGVASLDPSYGVVSCVRVEPEMMGVASLDPSYGGVSCVEHESNNRFRKKRNIGGYEVTGVVSGLELMRLHGNLQSRRMKNGKQAGKLRIALF
jgi:hypothetical protein